MDKTQISPKSVNSQLAVFLFREDENYIAYSPALDLSGYGKSEEEARQSFDIVLKEYFAYALSEGTLYQDLQKHGWNVHNDQITTPCISVLIANSQELSDILEQKDFKKYNEPIQLPAFA